MMLNLAMIGLALGEWRKRGSRIFACLAIAMQVWVVAALLWGWTYPRDWPTESERGVYLGVDFKDFPSEKYW